MSKTTMDRERATLATARNWCSTGAVVLSVVLVGLIGFGLMGPLISPMALLFMAFMIVAMILNWYLYRSHLAHLNENPEDISLSIGEVTWAELLATLAIYALISFALSWAFSDNLQRPFLESCWEQTGATEACTP